MENRYCIIMSGGVGSRFWPFSRTSCPKQFLDFFGMGRTMLQMTYDRIVRLIPRENIFIVTNEDYASLTYEQLPEVSHENILLESQRRNTAPCIAYACWKIKMKHPSANIVVTPSDALVINVEEFRRIISNAISFASEGERVVTLGIKPTRPETGYGYIAAAEAAVAAVPAEAQSLITNLAELEAAIKDIEHAIATVEALVADVEADIEDMVALAVQIADAVASLEATIKDIAQAANDVKEAVEAIKLVELTQHNNK